MGEEVKELLVQFVDRPLHPRTTMVGPISGLCFILRLMFTL